MSTPISFQFHLDQENSSKERQFQASCDYFVSDDHESTTMEIVNSHSFILSFPLSLFILPVLIHSFDILIHLYSYEDTSF